MEKRNACLAMLLYTCFIVFSCEKEIITPSCDGSEPTYIDDIRPIIGRNCPSCHGSGSSNGNFRTYQGLKPYLNNGKFRHLVLEKQTMPKGNRNLSQEELNKIQCWVDNNYPEN